HVELLGAPEGEAPVFFTGDIGLVAQLLAKACWEDETALGVERVLVLAEERRSLPVHHFTTTDPSMARQTPPCCTTSRHPTPRRSTSQPRHCTRDSGRGSLTPPADQGGDRRRARRRRAFPADRRGRRVGNRGPGAAGRRPGGALA